MKKWWHSSLCGEGDTILKTNSDIYCVNFNSHSSLYWASLNQRWSLKIPNKLSTSQQFYSIFTKVTWKWRVIVAFPHTVFNLTVLQFTTISKSCNNQLHSDDDAYNTFHSPICKILAKIISFMWETFVTIFFGIYFSFPNVWN